MSEPTHSGAICGASTDHLWYAVIIEQPAHRNTDVAMAHMQEVISYITFNCARGKWVLDWTHGEERSAPAAEKRQLRFLFEREDDAAMFRMRFG